MTQVEYGADAMAARLTGEPDALAAALARLSAGAARNQGERIRRLREMPPWSLAA